MIASAAIAQTALPPSPISGPRSQTTRLNYAPHSESSALQPSARPRNPPASHAKLVGMRLKPAVLGPLEGKSERVKSLLRAQPHEATLTQIDVGLKGICVARGRGFSTRPTRLPDRRRTRSSACDHRSRPARTSAPRRDQDSAAEGCSASGLIAHQPD